MNISQNLGINAPAPQLHPHYKVTFLLVDLSFLSAALYGRNLGMTIWVMMGGP
jgi:hypothetical protein